MREVFKFKKYNSIKFNKVYIFKLKIVNKIKGKIKLLMAFITAKEKANFKLVKQL